MQIRETDGWNRKGPLITKPFPVKMQVRRADFLTVRVAVRRTAEIEPRQDRDFSRTILVRSFREIDPRPPNIEKELLTPVR